MHGLPPGSRRNGRKRHQPGRRAEGVQQGADHYMFIMTKRTIPSSGQVRGSRWFLLAFAYLGGALRCRRGTPPSRSLSPQDPHAALTPALGADHLNPGGPDELYYPN